MDDLYRILELHTSASSADVKKSYQELALKYHPDKTNNQTSENLPADMFIKVNRAYRVLSDPELRRQYDVKWQERCLAQAYPIQDIVDFDEFEEAEMVSADEEVKSGQSDLFTGECNTAMCNSDEVQQSKGSNCDISSVISYKKDGSNSVNSGEHCTKGGNSNNCENENSEAVPCIKGVNSSDSNTDFKLTTDSNRISTSICTGASNSIADFDVNKSYCKHVQKSSLGHKTEQGKQSKSNVAQKVVYTYECRCGGSYMLTEVDVRLKFDIVCCDSCSLTVKINYTDENDDDDPSSL